MPRRAIATVIAAAIAVMAAMLTPLPAQAQPGSEAIERARSWVAADVGYSGSNYFTNQYGTYRTDCSGYVSMAWGLGSSYTTVTLPSVSYAIAKDALEAGDILNNPLPGTSGHVVLFAGWANAERTEYYAYEESPSGGAHLSQIPYPYWPGYGTFIPRRYIGTTSKAPAPVTIPERPAAPEPPEDGDLVRHDGQVYRIAGGAPMKIRRQISLRSGRQIDFVEQGAVDGKPVLMFHNVPYGVELPEAAIKASNGTFRASIPIAPKELMASTIRRLP